MNIAVAIRLMPKVGDELEVDESGTDIDRDLVEMAINEFDDQALEEAVLIKEATGATVTAVGLKADGIEEALRVAYARGADRVVIADAGAAYVAMHWRAHSAKMQRHATYGDVVHDVVTELEARVGAAVAAGVDPSRLVVDPGLGFAKTAEHNWELLRRLVELDRLGLPILVGSSRKSFLGTLLADEAGRPRHVLDREDANVALTTIAAIQGVWGVRVHEVRASVDAIAVVERWQAVR